MPKFQPTRPLSTVAAWQRGLLSRGAATIRRKLILLHTVFSLVVAVVLLLALRPPIQDLVVQEELRECRLAVEVLDARVRAGDLGLPDLGVRGVEVCRGGRAAEIVPVELAELARQRPGETLTLRDAGGGAPRATRFTDWWPTQPSAVAVRWNPGSGELLAASARSPDARSAMDRVYLILTVALLSVYALIALALEVLVLPRQVYGPIERLRDADEAVQAGRRDLEIIPEDKIPSDELGDIMRSRNASIVQLRKQESALGEALTRLEEVATELKRKNHLLEAARRNLEDQDRLASLGMMSAGIAHELNTPLAVLKGCVEQLAAGDAAARPGDAERAALMLRVVNRLERLSESLLDFARVRPPSASRVQVRPVVEEAWTLVSLDRDARGVEFTIEMDDGTTVVGDADRLTQVLVNLLRNAVDALESAVPRRVVVSANPQRREGRLWISVTIADSGPGIDPALFPRLFEPFASTRLDSTGTGLGLAVAEGIVREHSGVLLARNATAAEAARGLTGAVFELILPADGEAGH